MAEVHPRPQEPFSMAKERSLVGEIERVLKDPTLPNPDTATEGYYIGKALRALDGLDHGLVDIEKGLVDIENTLKMDKLPSPPQDQPSEILKLFFALKIFAKKQQEEAAINPTDKAFIDYAKNAATAGTGIFNAANFAGITLTYMIKDSSHLVQHPEMHAVFIIMSCLFLPISVLTLGMAHSLERRIHWINKVAMMLIFLVTFEAFLVGFFGYYLISHSPPGWVAGVTICGAGCLILPPMVAFKRPSWFCPIDLDKVLPNQS